MVKEPAKVIVMAMATVTALTMMRKIDQMAMAAVVVVVGIELQEEVGRVWSNPRPDEAGQP